jgi:alpha-D-ribose 1-methylphosphonate 5-triphosphate synthase subunit PhnL
MNSVVNVAEQESFVTLCGIGSVSGDALLTSVIPGLTSLTVAAEPLSDNGLENRTRKKRFRKLNTNNATTDTSYQSAVAMAMTDGVLQQTLDISGISFKSASDNHVLDDNVHGRVDSGLVRTWYNQRTGFI